MSVTVCLVSALEEPDHHRGVPRILLLLPTATYRASDFLAAAAGLGVDVVVGSEHRQALSGAMGDRAVVLPLDDVDAAVGAIVSFIVGARSMRCWRSTTKGW